MRQLACSDLTQKVCVETVHIPFVVILMRPQASGQLWFLGSYSLLVIDTGRWCKPKPPSLANHPGDIAEQSLD